MEQVPHFMDEIGLVAAGVRIAHWTPGRVRFSFEDYAEAEQFAYSVVNLKGVTRVKSNSLTGTVLIHYTDELENKGGVLMPSPQSLRQACDSDHHVCAQCRQPMGEAANSDFIRRFIGLIAAIIMGDVIGVVAWVWSAADSAQVVRPVQNPRQLSLAA